MNGVGIRLAGGPADGLEIVIPGDLMNPPHMYEMKRFDPRDGVRKVMYSRQVNPSSDGPPWLYRYFGEHAT